nr:type II toxin-antitoxin system antitoxin SocA domain-containing protein [Mycoplasmopsis bovis]
MLGEGILSDTAFQAWVHGPVSPELWHDYKEYGWNEIEQLKPNDEKFSKNILELLDAVWITYGE